MKPSMVDLIKVKSAANSLAEHAIAAFYVEGVDGMATEAPRAREAAQKDLEKLARLFGFALVPLEPEMTMTQDSPHSATWAGKEMA